jgi:TetR/AcrR family fatty acid metabolism transcriptional regulator
MQAVIKQVEEIKIDKEVGKVGDKREKILNAAIHVFAAKGFHYARVSDVAKEAGVADGTIYLYFKSKDDLLISLFEEKMEIIVNTFKEEVSQCESAQERLKKFVELHLKMVAQAPSLAEVMTVELRQSSKFMREYKAPMFGAYLDLLREVIVFGQNRGEIDEKRDPNLLKRIIFGALDELSLYWVHSKKPSAVLEQSVDELWLLCVDGLFKKTP